MLLSYSWNTQHTLSTTVIKLQALMLSIWLFAVKTTARKFILQCSEQMEYTYTLHGAIYQGLIISGGA